jgi:hypothetical protein
VPEKIEEKLRGKNSRLVLKKIFTSVKLRWKGVHRNGIKKAAGWN